jgi:hypothetical protein
MTGLPDERETNRLRGVHECTTCTERIPRRAHDHGSCQPLLRNSFLAPIDDRIIDAGVHHLRWMDDLLILGPTLAHCGRPVDAASGELSRLRLRLSASKSMSFDDPVLAAAHINDDLLASLSASPQWGFLPFAEPAFRDLATGAIDPTPARFRFLLKSLMNGRRSSTRQLLLRDAKLANVDPRMTGDYLLASGLIARAERSRSRGSGRSTDRCEDQASARGGGAAGFGFPRVAVAVADLRPFHEDLSEEHHRRIDGVFEFLAHVEVEFPVAARIR